MKLANTASKIAGVTLGEVTVSIMQQFGVGVGVKAKFALVTKDGDVGGFMDVVGGWSEKLEGALAKFVEALEEEGLRLIFEPGQATETQDTTAPNEPPQF